eukprot:714999-Pleurochrysis_carterae.AAC.1
MLAAAAPRSPPALALPTLCQSFQPAALRQAGARAVRSGNDEQSPAAHRLPPQPIAFYPCPPPSPLGLQPAGGGLALKSTSPHPVPARPRRSRRTTGG